MYFGLTLSYARKVFWKRMEDQPVFRQKENDLFYIFNKLCQRFGSKHFRSRWIRSHLVNSRDRQLYSRFLYGWNLSTYYKKGWSFLEILVSNVKNKNLSKRGGRVPDMLALVIECCLRYISNFFRYIPHFYPTSLKLYDVNLFHSCQRAVFLLSLAEICNLVVFMQVWVFVWTQSQEDAPLFEIFLI